MSGALGIIIRFFLGNVGREPGGIAACVSMNSLAAQGLPETSEAQQAFIFLK